MSVLRLPRKLARRLRARWCASRGHSTLRQIDGVIGHQVVRLSVCSRCEIILAGDVLPPRRTRRTARRRHVDPVSLIDAQGRPLATGGTVGPIRPFIVGESGPERIIRP